MSKRILVIGSGATAVQFAKWLGFGDVDRAIRIVATPSIRQAAIAEANTSCEKPQAWNIGATTTTSSTSTTSAGTLARAAAPWVIRLASSSDERPP